MVTQKHIFQKEYCQIHKKWKQANYIFDASKIIISHVVVWNLEIPESHVTNFDLCNVIGIDIQVFIDKARNFRSVYNFSKYL